MIRVATKNDTSLVASLLLAMYCEVKSKDNLLLDQFESLAIKHIEEDEVWLYADKALYIMRDDTPCVERTKLWNGVSVYIAPELRGSTVLAKLYKHMFEHYEGTIMGFTEVNSLHNRVLLKRHKLLGFVYEMRR